MDKKESLLKNSGPKNIDWSSAFKYYCTSLGNKYPSLRDVAREFSVSKKEVGLRAHKEKWLHRRRKVDKEGEELFSENKKETIAELNEKHLQAWKELRHLILEKLALMKKDEKLDLFELKCLVNTLKVVIDSERVSLGLPTQIKSAEIKTDNTTTSISPELFEEMDEFIRKNNHIMNDKPTTQV